MSSLARYIGGRVLLCSLLCLVVLSGMDSAAALVEELASLDRGGAWGAAFLHSSLELPESLRRQLPYAALIGCLIALGQAAGNNELSAAQAAGVGIQRLLWMALLPLLPLVLAGLLSAQYLAPSLLEKQQSPQGSAAASSQWLWNREEREYLSCAGIRPDGSLLHPQLVRMDEQGRLRQLLQAREAVFHGDHWQLREVSELRFDSLFQVRAQSHASLPWRPRIEPNIVRYSHINPQQLSLSALWDYARYLGLQEPRGRLIALKFWHKSLQPLAIVVLTLLAAALALGPLRKVGTGVRVACGVLLAVVFYTLEDVLASFSLIGLLPPLAAPLLLFCVFGAAALWILHRVR